MRDIQISRPVLIALVGAILIGGFMVLRGGQSDEIVAPASAPTAAPTNATGATGSSKKKKSKSKNASAAPTAATGATGASGVSGATAEVKKTAAQIKAERRKKLVAAAKEAGLPVAVYQAKKAGKEVIVFFWEPKGKDDERTNDGLLAVEKHRGNHLVVFRDKISNSSKYDGIAQAGELTQTPSMVFIYKEKADTAQGYYDGRAIDLKLERLSGYVPNDGVKR